ncbi:MAG: hypothetical protein EP335_05260 [Alphaproteobacteria bacterium]|nr:MAG: hypothetical protein EP335_05260 [Alphaproteobacteria bacterium]
MAGRTGRALVLGAFTFSLLILLAAALKGVAAEEASNPAQTNAETGAIPAPRAASQLSAPLVVPVYPLDSLREAAPEGADLRDSYILMEDGSVMSVADWILGALNRDAVGAGMTDYQNRLFLGQVARSMAGLNERLVDRTPVPHPVAGLAESVVGEPLRIGPFSIGGQDAGPNSALLSGAPRGIYALNDAIGTDDPAEINMGKIGLIERPYERHFRYATEDFRLTGTFMNMLRDYQKRDSAGD